MAHALNVCRSNSHSQYANAVLSSPRLQLSMHFKRTTWMRIPSPHHSRWARQRNIRSSHFSRRPIHFAQCGVPQPPTMLVTIVTHMLFRSARSASVLSDERRCCWRASIFFICTTKGNASKTTGKGALFRDCIVQSSQILLACIGLHTSRSDRSADVSFFFSRFGQIPSI